MTVTKSTTEEHNNLHHGRSKAVLAIADVLKMSQSRMKGSLKSCLACFSVIILVVCFANQTKWQNDNMDFAAVKRAVKNFAADSAHHEANNRLSFSLNTTESTQPPSERKSIPDHQRLKEPQQTFPKQAHSKYAYFTLMVGLQESTVYTSLGHKGFFGYLLNHVVTRYILETAGSTMDFIVLFKMAHETWSLPDAQAEVFKKLGTKVEYLPHDNSDGKFDSIIMEKFHMFRFHRYKQAIFLDADVMPLCNLDHYFNMTERGYFAPNLVYAWRKEPANAGFFVLSLDEADWKLYQSLQFINQTHGFGMPLEEPVETLGHPYTAWNWHEAHADQGLLYHWVRNIKKNVTIARSNRIERWEVDENQRVKLVKAVDDFNITCPNSLAVKREPWLRHAVYSDFFHFTGDRKPWKLNDWNSPLAINETTTKDTKKFDVWGLLLRRAWKKYNLGSVRGLFQNISSKHESEVEMIEKYLTV